MIKHSFKGTLLDARSNTLQHLQHTVAVSNNYVRRVCM
jgi:hypothetical protein